MEPSFVSNSILLYCEFHVIYKVSIIKLLKIQLQAFSRSLHLTIRRSHHATLIPHVHSNASDGTLSPEQVVRLAHEAGLSAIALTDPRYHGRCCQRRKRRGRTGVWRWCPASRCPAVSGTTKSISTAFVDTDSPS